MKNIVIAGTGGLAAEVTDYVKENQINCKEFPYRLKGYLDITNTNMRKYNYDKPLLGDEFNYEPEVSDCFIIAIGIIEIRNKVINRLKNKDADLVNLVHHSARISQSLDIGEGNIIGPFCNIGPNTRIGNYNIINYYTSVAHDCIMGDFNVISPNNIINGNCNIGNSNFLGASVTLFPNTIIGSKSKIGAGTVVRGEVKNDSLLYEDKKYRTSFNH